MGGGDGINSDFFWICKSNFCFIMENFPALKTLDWIFVLKIANIWMDWLECIGVLTFKLIENVNIKAVIRQHLVDTQSDTTSIVYDHARQGLVRCGSSSGLYLVLVIMQSEVWPHSQWQHVGDQAGDKPTNETVLQERGSEGFRREFQICL